MRETITDLRLYLVLIQLVDPSRLERLFVPRTRDSEEVTLAVIASHI